MKKYNPQHKPCPNCGKELEFSALSCQLFCQHCQQNFAISGQDENVEITEKDYQKQLAELGDGAELDERIVAHCANCGAEIVLQENIVADRCNYCDSPIVAAEKSQRIIRPSRLIPFKINQEQAGFFFRKWLKSRWFLPGAIHQEAKTRSFQGTYLPYWTYDCQTLSEYTGQRGEYYYVTVHYTVRVNGRTQTRSRSERRTRWYPAAGIVQNRFNDLLVTGNSSCPPELQNALTPWYLADLKPYRPDFIRGFQEQSYSIPLENGFAEAKAQMSPVIERAIRADIGGDTQRIEHVNIDHHDIRFKLILLPIWINSLHFRGKTYPFLVNAQTGEVQGKRPWSAAKITTLALSILLFIAILVYFFLQDSSNPFPQSRTSPGYPAIYCRIEHQRSPRVSLPASCCFRYSQFKTFSCKSFTV